MCQPKFPKVMNEKRGKRNVISSFERDCADACRVSQSSQHRKREKRGIADQDEEVELGYYEYKGKKYNMERGKIKLFCSVLGT